MPAAASLFGLSGKTAIVTGGSRGIGAAVCRLGAKAGYDVVVNYAARRDAAEALVAEIEAGGGRAVAVKADVGVEAEILALFEAADRDRFGESWTSIQAAFVDDPRDAVKEADTLVAELMQRLAETFSAERSRLESQWDNDQDVSTEDLRIALQRYRSFFDRLLSA